MSPLSLFSEGAILLAVLILVFMFVVPRLKKARAEKQVKQTDEARQALKDLSIGSKAQPLPEAVPPTVPPDATQGRITSLEVLTIGQKVELELTRVTADAKKRVVVARGTTKITADRLGRPPKVMFILVKLGGRPGLYWADPKGIIEYLDAKERKHLKLVFDLLHSEPLDLNGNLTWSDDLEMVLADSAEDQYVVIASSDLAFRFTRTLVYAMLLVAFLSVVLGIAVNGAAHLIPIVQIRWIP